MPPKKDNKDGEDRESRDTAPYISFSDMEKSMTSFSGDDTYPISIWFDEFEDTALLMNWTEIEKLIYAKRLLSGTAKLFLRSLGGVRDYKILKQELEEEFGSKLNSAVIHKQLSSRKMKRDETLQQYFLHMKECALHGNIEDAALMEYVIDGIQDSEYNKSILYGAANIKEFRTKLDIYKNIKEKTQTRPYVPTPPTKHYKAKRCFNCGDLDHEAPTCTKGIKCFKCNEFGHKSNECTNKEKKILNIRNENAKAEIGEEEKELKAPLKKVTINNMEITALIDTGSDVNLIKLSQVEKVMTEKTKYDTQRTINLTGIAGKELGTEGLLEAKVMIDDYYADMEFHVVQDYAIPVNVILGNPILKDFEVNFTADGVFLKKITNLTLLTEKKRTICDEYYPENKEIKEKITKTIEEYKPDVKKKESNIKIILTEEDPIHQSPRRLSPAENRKKKDLPPRVARWALLLKENNYEIEHRSRSRLKHADALSRNLRKSEALVSRESNIANMKGKLIDNCVECILRGIKEEYLHPLDKDEALDKLRVQRCLNSTWQRSIGMISIFENEEIMKLIEEEEFNWYTKEREVMG